MLKRLDEVEHLQTISLTGGEPAFLGKTVDNVIVPLLKYAKERGIRTQINSNLTLDISRYEKILPYLDVMHISFNYLNGDDFYEVGFANSARPVSKETAYKMYDTMLVNSEKLSAVGMYISAESMINYRTHTKLSGIHKLIKDMGQAARGSPDVCLKLCFRSARIVLGRHESRHPPIAGCPGSGHVDAVRNASLLCLRLR